MTTLSKQNECLNGGCKYYKEPNQKFCSSCGKAGGPMTPKVRKNTLNLYRKAQDYFQTRSATKDVIPNDRLHFYIAKIENSYELFCSMRKKKIYISSKQASNLVAIRGVPHLWYSLVSDRLNLNESEAPGCYYYKRETKPNLSITLYDNGRSSFSIDHYWFDHNKGIPFDILSKFFKQLPLEICSIICKFTHPIDILYGKPINEDNYNNQKKETICCSGKE